MIRLYDHELCDDCYKVRLAVLRRENHRLRAVRDAIEAHASS